MSFGFKRVLSLATICKFIAFLAFLLALSSNCLVTLSLLAYSMFVQIFFAIGVEFSCELGFPAGEATSSGLVVASGCIYSFITSHVINGLVSSPGAFLLFLLLNFLLSLLCLYHLEETLHRRDFEIEEGHQEMVSIAIS